MEQIGTDMGDYREPYKGYELEVAIEQQITGVKSHFRVLKGNKVIVNWRLLPIDSYWSTERKSINAAFTAARKVVDCELSFR